MRLYNTPDKKIVELDLPTDRPIKLYTCGPTVYDYPHIGNWYTFVRYDLLNRVLIASGHTTSWVMNLTDVGHLVSDADEGEDKLEKGAKREGKTAWDVAKYYSDYFLEGLKRLNFSEVTKLPKATDYIDEQIELVKTLEAKGYTYLIDDGVYFDTSKFTAYPDFAHLNLTSQEEGARVEVNSQKRNSSDFAIWKLSPADSKRDMEWDSPWGKGFPGWHLECSAMIHKELGEPIDIHAGGVDHIQVHHTNEIAQTTAAYDKPLSRYWMHCNHIQVNGKKMAKSNGSFIKLEDIEAKGFSLEVFRLHILSGYYRSQSEFSWDSLSATKNRLQKWVDNLCEAIQKSPDLSISDTDTTKILEALTNDLNSPEALSIIDSALEVCTGKSNITQLAHQIDELLGLSLSQKITDITDEQKELIASSDKARTDNDWATSDSIRGELHAQGITLRNTASGSIWSRLV